MLLSCVLRLKALLPRCSKLLPISQEGEVTSPFISSLEHEVLMVSYCGQSMSVVRRQQLVLKAYSSYTPGPIDLILGRKHRGDL